MKSGGWLYAALIMAALELAPPISRADAPKPDADTLEQVIVTAERRAERTLDVPASISVISAADIERLHATSLIDLVAAAPGLVVIPAGSPGQGEIVLRGLTSFTSSTLVATVIDDAAVGSSGGWTGDSGFALDLFPYDLERIEILRGPQGTLYGANSMGGVVKYVTKVPSLTAREAQFGGETFVIKGGGSLGYAARGTWSAPLIDGTLAVRGSLYVRETPGFIKNPLRGLNHENTLSQDGGRLALLWQPATELKVKLQGIYQKIDSGGDAFIFAQAVGTPQDPYYRPGNWAYGDLTYPHPVPEPFFSSLVFFSGTLDWHTAFMDLVSVTSYSDKWASQKQDFTGFLDPSIPVQTRFEPSVRRASQEIRLVSPSGQHLEWVAGTYYSSEKATDNQYIDVLDSQLKPIPALNPFFAALIPATYSEAAVFGTMTYRIADQFDLTGGLRWLTNRQKVENDILPNYYLPVSDSVTRSAETPSTYLFSARFRPQPETMVYLRVASGYRPGTPNQVVPGYPEIPPLAHSDTMVNYEFGIKTEILNRKATLDLDAFKIYWKDMQIDIPSADGRVSYTVNGGSVTSEGFEFAATYWPSDALHLAVNTAYTDVYATEALPTANIFVGTRLPGSPKWTAAAMLDYRPPHWGEWTPQLSGTWRYVSTQYSTLSTFPPVGLIPAYSWVDLDVRMTSARYELSLYAKNLTDKRTYSNGGPGTDMNGNLVFGGVTITPRTIGLSATLTF
jgi:outer membrane receptor protein involved in Fe transport